jgi:hypothetical protein
MTSNDIKNLAEEAGIPYNNLRKVIAVESGGYGFDPKTGKIIIQFEPHWFKRLFPRWANFAGVWATNKVEKQPGEWVAFNNAFSKNPTAAMESTSLGLPQIMGFWWKNLGFTSVGAFWDFMKASEINQIKAMIAFIRLTPKMHKALLVGDWDTFAFYYNGAQYKKFRYADRLREA